ncbi:MAG: hypothetical protein ABID63_02885 [Pseudomonadota bacterium]
MRFQKKSCCVAQNNHNQIMGFARFWNFFKIQVLGLKGLIEIFKHNRNAADPIFCRAGRSADTMIFSGKFRAEKTFDDRHRIMIFRDQKDIHRKLPLG